MTVEDQLLQVQQTKTEIDAVFYQTAQDPKSLLLQPISIHKTLVPSRDSPWLEVDIRTFWE